MIGRTLDRYRIEAKLGEGGIGVVYRACDTYLNRLVALKIIPPEKVVEPNRRERFIREARAASALNHPKTVTVHDVRSDGGVDFIVLEHVEGRPLNAVIPPRVCPFGSPCSTARRSPTGLRPHTARAFFIAI